MPSRRIAILFHEKDNEHSIKHYVISLFADWWRQDGYEVINLFGVSKFVPADLIFVHIDLSVVPNEFLEFAKLYQRAVNGRVSDIRKSNYSSGILTAGDSYGGKVIVKSEYNHAGKPERRIYGDKFPHMFDGPLQYQLFDSLAEVPETCFDSPYTLVQKFQPEMEGDLFCVRMLHFLGDKVTCVRLKAETPIVNGHTSVAVDEPEPDPQIMAMRATLGFDYGKFDYVMVDGKAILLDANKTVGTAGPSRNERFQQLRRYRAAGINQFFPQPSLSITVSQ